MPHGLLRAASVVSGPRIMHINQFANYVLEVDYLLNPPEFSDVPRRSGAAIAILVTHYFLLLPVLVSYTRLIHTIVTNPAYIPRREQGSPQEPQEPQEKPRASASSEYSPRSSGQSSAA